jgi:hypothetical protein
MEDRRIIVEPGKAPDRTSNFGPTFGASPHVAGVLTEAQRSLIAGRVKAGRLSGDTGMRHGPQRRPMPVVVAVDPWAFDPDRTTRREASVAPPVAR